MRRASHRNVVELKTRLKRGVCTSAASLLTQQPGLHFFEVMGTIKRLKHQRRSVRFAFYRMD